MAPRKKAEEKATANEAADLVLEYLRKQNRPYSAIDVSANLHNKVTKGKQIVYHALQNAAEACTTEQLAVLDETIVDLRTQTTTLVAAAKNLRGSLSSLNSTLSTADLVANVNTLETEKEQIESRLDGLRKGKAKKVTTSEREAIEKEWKKSIRVAKKRQKIVTEMWKEIKENFPDPQEREDQREMFDLDG
ncbi:uncharacterized protein J4E88_001435 [Alternaria novae-zelandiae]|uniref:uncharacterized protein n=1 Tax=Alternaria novae-zelandiae TaxID=430562 RepID=UPI0020C4B272|nr:uncharacterized protein J4E88_001435 [Alternaria novae-zelandiae]KAI4693064.1 hypothetical protein J4E88_001435 [Alternaria novae-zelandiae]